MPTNTVVRACIDTDIEEEASAVLLTVSDALRILLIHIAHEKVLPFEPLIPNSATILAMEEAQKDNLESITLDQLQAVFNKNRKSFRGIYE
ncbi:type II toxin-antitoxin system antitoxin, RelB/DinJ family [Chromatium okenii]|uniref:type II toxin-antitoxin system RelB/DinJ family antitoxin n=1 Tax=Chromatium okenii TaxID=61644 RepID=UPI001907B43E|nr:type II toxin-antitoxin system RelB/DinJ family antitoxin [Chromatium okenii]MBK1641461.1 type II toxin-antitoxin system antitoxin, RelB/DinJ family [Chromatium okenii]